MAAPNDTGDATNRRLRLLVGLVVMFAAGVIVWSLVRLPAFMAHLPQASLLTAAVAGATLLRIRIRVRAAGDDFAIVSTAVLLTVAFIDPAWVAIITGAGMLVGRMITGALDPLKLSFNVGKEILCAIAAAGAAGLTGLQPILRSGGDPRLLNVLLGLGAAIAAYTVVDEVISQTLFSIVTRTTLRQRLLSHWDTTLINKAGALVIAFVAVWAYTIDPWFIAVMPPLMVTLHLTSTNRVHSRQENDAWQRLAQATDELNAVDLTAVLHTAVRRAAGLFSADEIEVEIRPPGGEARMVRGDSTDITYDGGLIEGEQMAGFAIPIALENYRGDADLGELRLRFSGPVTLSERERYTLRTFAAALCTAVRNALTFVETQHLAESHARAAAQDPLTQLANRRRLQQYGDDVLSAVPANGISALLLIDLNHFKEVNDTLGHAAGDRVLVAVARRLAETVQERDLVARLGGDEFAVLFVGLSAPAVAEARARAVLDALAAPIDLDGMRISVEASGGVATALSSGGVGELLRRADVAMYQAKREGQRIVVYSSARDTADLGSLTLGGDLARAVAEHQFTVNFQPIIDLGTGEAIAAEALTRWHHPDRGYLAPDRFLSAVERSGQLGAFADAVLDQALAAAVTWSDAGYPIPVAVNVSPRSLLDPGFPDAVAGRLAARGVPPESLVIELTESVTLSKLEVVDEVLAALRSLGVRLALDDFGTGFSSLATLARVTVDELKIDRGFVGKMDESAPGAVIRSTIELGRSLDLLVVAEGVEHEDQRRQLWELGCPAGQGHLFARAMPAHRLLAALNRGCGGRPGTLALPLHGKGEVIQMPLGRRARRSGLGDAGQEWPS